MAQDLDDGEFWLPSEFLTDDDLLTDFKSVGFGINSGLSSPGESVMGSTETESDEDEFLAGLTWQMSRSTLHDSSKGLKLSGSPQSTLCGCKAAGSSRGSPNSVSRVSSPPDRKDVGWDFLYAAAGEVARMRLIEESAVFHSSSSNKQHFPPPKPSPVSIPPANKLNSGAGFYPPQTQNQHHLSNYLQLQANQRIKQQQMLRNGVWGQSNNIDYQFNNGRAVGAGRTQGLSTAAWPTLQQSQQQTGSGMRAVFLGGTGPKKERTGTGVFLPRRVGTNNQPENRKKAGCSTVLLPERVVHALNLNLDPVVEPQHLFRSHGSFTPQYDSSALNRRSNLLMSEQQRNIHLQQTVMCPEISLPQEWTY